VATFWQRSVVTQCQLTVSNSVQLTESVVFNAGTQQLNQTSKYVAINPTALTVLPAELFVI